MKFPALLFFLLVAVSVGAAACGGGESEAEREAERSKVKCEGAALASTRLPASFPAVEGVTLTKQASQGPTQVVDGYYAGELETAYERFKAALEGAGYDVLFDEIEDEDSEVSYKGGGRTGQVALRKNCEQSGRISVHITSRPE